jgi:hypothetical protein
VPAIAAVFFLNTHVLGLENAYTCDIRQGPLAGSLDDLLGRLESQEMTEQAARYND